MKGSTNPEDNVLSLEWLHRFSEEVCSPQHRLLCPTRGFLAFVPNPCADLEDSNVLLMYEAIGMVLALAVAHRIPLHPALPVWLARSLLGYPTTMQDLNEFDPQLCQKYVHLCYSYTQYPTPFATQTRNFAEGNTGTVVCFSELTP